MKLLRGNRRVLEQTFLNMRKVSVHIAAWCNALVYLEDMNALPWEFLLSQGAQHDPGRSTAADSHHELAPVGNGGAGLCRNRFRRRLCSRCFVGKHFSLHPEPFPCP